MATTTPTPTPTPAPIPAPTVGQTIGQDIIKFLPVLELGANVALLGLGGAGVIPPGSSAIATAIEGGINPLIQSIQQGNSKTTDAVVAISAVIAALNVLKGQVKDTATLAKINAYLTAAQAGLQGWITGGQGFDASKLTPVTPIV